MALQNVESRPKADPSAIPHLPASGFVRLPGILAPKRAYSRQQVYVVGRHQRWALSKAREARPTHHRMACGGYPRPHRWGCERALISEAPVF